MNFKTSKIFDAGGDLSQRWFVFYYFRDPDTNKFQRFREWVPAKYITRTQRYDKARELRKQIDRRLQLGWNPFASKSRNLTSLWQCLDYFLDSKKSAVRNRTLISYRSYIKKFKEWLEKKNYDKMPVESFNYYMASEYMDYFRSTGKSRRTWNNTLQAIRTCFNFLVNKEFIVINPFFKIHKVKVEETEIISFTDNELKILKNNLPKFDYNLYVIALMIFDWFLRPQEIVRLKVRHLKDLRNQITIPGNISKNKKNGTIANPMDVKNAIKNLDLNFPDNYFVFGSNLERNEKMIAPTRIAEKWREFANQYGISKNIYALKHTGNGIALENGISVRDLQLQNRHSSLEETQKYLDRFRKTPSDSFLSKFPTL